MRLIKATSDFKLHSQSYEGFPLIVDLEMELVEPVFQFLIYYCITRGRVESKHTWWSYGQAMYDYFGYLEAMNLDWKSGMANNHHSIVAAYRDWSVGIGLNNTTINSRLRIIIQFYEFAVRKNWIKTVPYDIELILVNKSKGFLTHTDRSGNIKPSANVMLKTKKSQLQILTKSEVEKLMSHETLISHHLIYRFALQTGMRREELVTFPVL